MVTILLLSTLALVFLDRMRHGVVALGVQGAAIAGMAALAGVSGGETHLIWVAVVAFAVKAVAIPLVLLWVLQILKVHATVERLMTTKSTLLLSVVLMMLAYYVTGSLGLPSGSLARLGLPVAIMLVLIGCFVMITRKKALSQVLGLMVVENGLSLAALVLVSNMPFVVDLALSFDALVGVFIMGIFIQRIHAEFQTSNTDPLQKLRG